MTFYFFGQPLVLSISAIKTTQHPEYHEDGEECKSAKPAPIYNKFHFHLPEK